jgi:hypothetical protein
LIDNANTQKEIDDLSLKNIYDSIVSMIEVEFQSLDNDLEGE